MPDAWSETTLNIPAPAHFLAECYLLMEQTPQPVEQKNCLADPALISSHRIVSKWNGVI